MFRINSTTGTINISNSQITTSGYGYAITTQNSSTGVVVTIKDSQITTNGPVNTLYTGETAQKDGAAIHMGNSASANNTLTITGSTITSTSNQAILLEGKTAVVMTNSTARVLTDTNNAIASGDTTNAVIYSSRDNSIVLNNSVLDASQADMRRAIYVPAGTTITATDSTFRGSTTSGTCPVIKGTVANMTFYGANTVSGGTLTLEGAGWAIEDRGSAVTNEDTTVTTFYHVTYGDAEATSIVLGIDMLDGAAVRCVEDSSGIRFISKLEGTEGWAQVKQVSTKVGDADATTVTTITNMDDAVKGTIIFKNSDLTAYLAANSGKTVYDFIAAAKGGAYKIADITATSNGTHIDNGDTYLFAALVNLNDYTMDFGAVSYVEYAGQRIYSAFDADNNVRNIQEVATAAYNDYEAEENTVKDGYLYYNYVEGEGYSCYSDAQRAILEGFLAA